MQDAGVLEGGSLEHLPSADTRGDPTAHFVEAVETWRVGIDRRAGCVSAEEEPRMVPREICGYGISRGGDGFEYIGGRVAKLILAKPGTFGRAVPRKQLRRI